MSSTRDPLFTRRFWLGCAVHFSGAMASSLYILFPLFVRELGGTEFTIGLYAGTTGAAAVAARLPVGRLLDTRGRRRVLAGAGVLHVTSWLAFLSFNALGLRGALLVAAYGFASGSLFAAYFTYASDIIPVTRRSEGFAMFGIWGMLPNGLGPALGEFLIAHGGFTAYFLTGAAFALLSLGLSFMLSETVSGTVGGSTVPPAAAARFPLRRFLFLLSATFVFGVAVNGLFTFLAPFAYVHGRASVGRFFMSYAISAVAVRVLTGRLPDRIGLRRVLIPALLLYACGLLFVPHADNLALIVVGVMCGAGHGYAFPILSVLVIDQVPLAYRGRAISWFTAMFDLGNTLGNPLLGAVAGWVGYGAMFHTTGVGMLITAAAVWHRLALPGPAPRPPGARYDPARYPDASPSSK